MSDFVIIDAHLHLWEKQDGCVKNLPVRSLGNGKSSFLGGVHQMMPPYMTDGVNSAERLLANMDFLLVCSYEAEGANPELLLYKKR